MKAQQNVVVSLGELLKVRDGHLDTVSASEKKVAADRNRAEAMMDSSHRAPTDVIQLRVQVRQ